MAGTIKGITIAIEGKTSGLVKALNNVNKGLKDTQSQLKIVDKALQLNPKSFDTIRTKQKLLSTAISETKEKLELEKQVAKDAKEALKLGNISQNEYNALKAEVVSTTAELKQLKAEAKENRTSLLHLGKSAEESAEKAEKAKEKWKDFGSAVADGLEVATKAIGTATLAVAGATTALVTSAVEGYASLEQLEGGMTKLYGDDAQTVIENANNAFLTAGMSATEYMETATSISASLINSLGGDTEEAARMTDVAIRAMSDNASVFGTDLSTIQSAFVGFSRGQYQMLDSLSLGYAGTQEGMIQLINDSGILEDTIEDLDNVNFAQMVEAIQAVQENMNIAGNTANEALGTISGSVDATKSAWSNLVTGLADPNADIGQLIDNMVTAGMAALTNIEPAVEQALGGIVEALPLLTEVIATELPVILNDLLPPLIEAVGELLSALCEALPDLIAVITEIIPDLFTTVLEAVLENLPELIECTLDMMLTITETLLNNLPMIINSAIQIILALVNSLTNNLPTLIPVMVEAMLTIVDALLDNLPMLIQCALDLMIALAQGLVEALPEVVARIPEIVDGIVTALFDTWDYIKSNFATWGADLINGFVQGIMDNIGTLTDGVSSIANTVSSYLHFSRPDVGPLRYYEEWMPDFIDGLSDGIDSNLYRLQNSVGDMALTMESGMTSVDYSGALNGISSQLGAMAGGSNTPINVYIGNDRIGTAIARSNSRMALISGGM